MLAAAYAYDGQWDRFLTMLAETEKRTPETPEDYLFKGYAVANHDPSLGIQDIDKAIKLRPSMTVAFLLRAEVRAWQAQDKDDLDLANKAVQEADFAKDLLKNNPAALWVRLHANLIKAAYYLRHVEPSKRETALAAGKQDAEALAEFSSLPDAVVFRWLYYREVGAEDQLLGELEKANNATDNQHQYVTFYYALTLYKHGEFEKARDALSGKRGCCIDILRPFVVAEIGNPEQGKNRNHGLQGFRRSQDERSPASRPNRVAITWRTRGGLVGLLGVATTPELVSRAASRDVAMSAIQLGRTLTRAYCFGSGDGEIVWWGPVRCSLLHRHDLAG